MRAEFAASTLSRFLLGGVGVRQREALLRHSSNHTRAVSEVSRRVDTRGSRGETTMSRFVKSAITLAAGAAIAYLFDPVSGRSRRARLADQAAARGRDAAEQARVEAQFRVGRAKGFAHEVLDTDGDMPADDAELLQKVRSEAIGPSGVPTDRLEVHVDSGRVVIRGQVPFDADVEGLIESIRSVTGVRSVEHDLERV